MMTAPDPGVCRQLIAARKRQASVSCFKLWDFPEAMVYAPLSINWVFLFFARTRSADAQQEGAGNGIEVRGIWIDFK